MNVSEPFFKNHFSPLGDFCLAKQHRDEKFSLKTNINYNFFIDCFTNVDQFSLRLSHLVDNLKFNHQMIVIDENSMIETKKLKVFRKQGNFSFVFEYFDIKDNGCCYVPYTRHHVFFFCCCCFASP